LIKSVSLYQVLPDVAKKPVNFVVKVVSSFRHHHYHTVVLCIIVSMMFSEVFLLYDAMHNFNLSVCLAICRMLVLFQNSIKHL